MEYIKTSCPLCGSDSQYCLVDHDNSKYFRCKICTDFQISSRGEGLTQEASDEWKKKASKDARESDYNQVLIIDMVEISKLTHGEDPYPIMYFCHRTKIRQCL